MLRGRRRVRRTVGLARFAVFGIGVVALAAGASPGWAARADRGVGWRIAAALKHCRTLGSLSSVVATSSKDAWAMGSLAGNGPACSIDLEHWNGTRWQRVMTPRGASFSSLTGIPAGPIAASSRTDVWIFPSRTELFGGCGCMFSYPPRWNGAKWQASRLPVRMVVESAATFGTQDAWAFGTTNPANGAAQVPYAARFNDRAARPVVVV
jgi:hypothetical protein